MARYPATQHVSRCRWWKSVSNRTESVDYCNREDPESMHCQYCLKLPQVWARTEDIAIAPVHCWKQTLHQKQYGRLQHLSLSVPCEPTSGGPPAVWLNHGHRREWVCSRTTSIFGVSWHECVSNCIRSTWFPRQHTSCSTPSLTIGHCQ